jgi:hypothetical protein
VAIAALTGPVSVFGQAAAPGQTTRNVEVDPIRCWWRTSAGAVRTGETFSVVLTCAVLDTQAVQVVPDESRLGTATAQMAPFEVVGGTHPPDLHAGQRRFFQYEYTLRAIGPDLIGRDVPLPEMQVPYRINSRVGGNASQAGRDLTYVLPPQSVRVTSMVPEDAADIRDTTDQSFARIETLNSRAGVLDVVAFTMMALAGLMSVLALAGIIRRARPAHAQGEQPLSPAAVTSLAVSELADVQREQERTGWTDALVDRALAATRIAATCAVGHRVSDRLTDLGAEAGEGRLVLTKRLGRRRIRRAVSSAMTASELSRAIDRLPASAAGARRQRLEELRDALAAFGSARYGRAAEFDRSTLDRALENALTRAREVRADERWPKAAFRRWSLRAGLVESHT